MKIKAQKREFRNYLGGLLGESYRKNLSQIADNNINVTYHELHHFLTESTWDYKEINEQRLNIISSTRQTKINRYFSLIIDDSGHRKVVISLMVWEDNTSDKLVKLIRSM